MGRRFAELEEVYSTLTAIDFNFDSLPVNNKYRKYREWKLDPEKRKLDPGAAQNTGDRKVVLLNPFGLPADPDNKFIVKMSGRAFAQIGGAAGTASLYRLTTDSIPPTAKGLPGLVPAKAHLAVKGATTNDISKITGRPYKSRTGESYVIPFGRETETQTEFTVQDAILANRAATAVVSFTPERLRRI